ncbi:MAG: bifunctional glutamate N-acetyltransferase/amino-acid acetyltransferase ArgJ [Deltaproteobacteria bacterium]|nr:bifunctional glutamate N-acetyltransferase/amino-acid acetyltransferase ArgJ [Deltaproteobacteria bacterium]
MLEKKDELFAVPGFLANGIACGIKEDGKKDLALIYSERSAKAAGLFTTNIFKAAPVILDMEKIKGGMAQAILTNSGNANAANGSAGYDDAVAMSRSAAKQLRIPETLVLAASTGVIGRRLPVHKIEAGMASLVAGLNAGGIPAAEEAMMTTDKFPKMSVRRGVCGSKEITVCGLAKGAGMIEPHMATLLTYVLTDAEVESQTLNRIFRYAVGKSFNAISVDGCMSTNDTAIILANGRAGNTPIKGRSKDAVIFRDMVTAVMSDLSQDMVRDGEGATKVVEIVVEEAKTAGDAKKVAYAVANSNLVKTAFFGGDPNWGRIIQAAGAVGIPLPVDSVGVYFDGIAVFENGRGVYGHEKTVAEVMKKANIRLTIKLGMGAKTFRLHASDLSFEYVEINAHYTT